MIRILIMGGADLDDTVSTGLGSVLGRGSRMLKNDVQMTVFPRQRGLMYLVCLVHENRQRTRPRALDGYPYRHEKHREERPQPDHAARDTPSSTPGQLEPTRPAE
ncbi:MAG: hypothetical protein HYR72_24420 [Deltaproteobacteria bacterium]|nr:hypothetical protein [Deltaproteobacteria bacterium]MBI3389248.1 hypothetical protein [Deltaproteobacteria bacterium]